MNSRVLPTLTLAWLVAAGAAARGATVSATNAPPDVFAARRLELLPPFSQVRTYPIRFPALSPALSVRSMAWAGGKLWLAAQTLDQPPPRPDVGRLWRFDPEANRLEQIQGPISQNWVAGLAPAESRLWMALDGGVASIDVGDLSLDPYAAARGVTTSTLSGVGFVGGTLHALAWTGAQFALRPGASNFIQAAPPPELRPGEERVWRAFATSGLWSLAVNETNAAALPAGVGHWTVYGPGLFRGSPRFAPGSFTSVAGDGDGGFWLGSDQGLHHLNPETGAVQNRFAPYTARVAGGFDMAVSAWIKPTPAGVSQARARVMNGVRDRMRDRARRARLPAGERELSSPVWPTSRIPGAVTAVLRDEDRLWIAASDGFNTNATRVLLYHPLSRRWVGWIGVPGVVRRMAANDRYLVVAIDGVGGPKEAPLVAIEKYSLIAVPPARWTPDEIPAAEVERRLSGLPVRERAVYHFFGEHPDQVVGLLAPGGVAPPGADAESLFLLAFANDAVGLDRPDALAHWVSELQKRFPNSLLTELATSAVAPAAPDPAPDAAPGAPGVETADEVLQRRDLNGDGRINPMEFKLWRGPAADFKAADRNGDGFLDRAEIEQLLKRP